MFKVNKKVQEIALEDDFEILEINEATELEEMGASSTICVSSTCSKNNLISH